MGDTARISAQGDTAPVALLEAPEVQALALDYWPLTQEALDEAQRVVSGWPGLGPQQWEGVASALRLRLRDRL